MFSYRIPSRWMAIISALVILNSFSIIYAQTNPATISDQDTAFSWDRPDIQAGAGERAATIQSQQATIGLNVAGATQAPLGIFAVDALVQPRLNGLPLLASMPTESSFTIFPDGSAQWTYGDNFRHDWRGRMSQWETVPPEPEEPDIYAVDRLSPDATDAKVARDADFEAVYDMFFLKDPEGGITFHWSGELRYCFNFGRPITALALSTPDGTKRTTFAAPPGFTIRASADKTNWSTLWESSTEARHQPQVQLPAELYGATNLCLGFGSQTEALYNMEALYISVAFDAPDLLDLTQFPQGAYTLTYDDDSASSHHAILFWEDASIQYAPSPTPSDQLIQDDGDTLRLSWPNGIVLAFKRAPNGGLGRLASLRINGQSVLEDYPNDAPSAPIALTVLDGQPAPLPENFDWAAYRDAYIQNNYVWQSLWQRQQRTLSLEQAQFDGARAEGQTVILQWTVVENGQTGTVEWLLAPVSLNLIGESFSGITSTVRVSGAALQTAESVSLQFPLAPATGDWMIAQSFRKLIEEPFNYQNLGDYPSPIRWFAMHQSFAFRSGLGKTVLAFFDTPTAATVRLNMEGGRHIYNFQIPLGAGDVRQTTPLYWVMSPRGAVTSWAAADIWASVYEELKTTYSQGQGVIASRPVPSVVWNLPLEEDVFGALEHFLQTGQYYEAGQSWFDRFTQTQLPRAEAAGIRNLIIQPPWISDAEDPDLIASLHAPRALSVSPMLGGEEALKRLVEEAHRRGILITLWYPSSASLYAPFVADNLDWIAWQIDGQPEDGGWGDIVGFDTQDGYGQYAVAQLSALHERIPFDGLWLDSWDGLTILTDYANPQPYPQLDSAIALQRAFGQMGLSQIIIEGLGLIGRPDAYGDYETYTGPPNPLPEQVAELERLRNHEYLLYRIGAGTYIDMEIYYRALAAGGLINIANFDEIDALSPADRDWLRQINLAHRQVVDQMQYRKLLVSSAGEWLGVAWRNAVDDSAILFTFAPINYRTTGCAVLTDIISGTHTKVGTTMGDTEIALAANRIYRLQPDASCTAQ